MVISPYALQCDCKLNITMHIVLSKHLFNRFWISRKHCRHMCPLLLVCHEDVTTITHLQRTNCISSFLWFLRMMYPRITSKNMTFPYGAISVMVIPFEYGQDQIFNDTIACYPSQRGDIIPAPYTNNYIFYLNNIHHHISR